MYSTFQDNFEQLYIDLVEKAAIAIMVEDIEGNIVFCNRQTSDLFGYSHEEMNGINLSMLIHPDDYEKVMGYHKSRIAGKEVPSRYEYKAQKKDGAMIHIEAVATAQRQNGKIIGTRAYLLDITNRKEMEDSLCHALDILRNNSFTLVQVIGNMIERRDPYTANHHRRVANLARTIAKEMGLSRDQIEGIRISGLIHDIGKISIPTDILAKPSKLTEIEIALIKNHTLVGYELLKDIDFPWPVAEIVRQHHERINGSGYPSGLTDGQILLEARIIAVADVVEAMSSHRPYRPALGVDKALQEITGNSGLLYDPQVVNACMNIFGHDEFRSNIEAGFQTLIIN